MPPNVCTCLLLYSQGRKEGEVEVKDSQSEQVSGQISEYECLS